MSSVRNFRKIRDPTLGIKRNTPRQTLQITGRLVFTPIFSYDMGAGNHFVYMGSFIEPYWVKQRQTSKIRHGLECTYLDDPLGLVDIIGEVRARFSKMNSLNTAQGLRIRSVRNPTLVRGTLSKLQPRYLRQPQSYRRLGISGVSKWSPAPLSSPSVVYSDQPNSVSLTCY